MSKNYNKNSSAECITVNSVDIENIKKTKWIVVLERIDFNIYGVDAGCLKNDRLVPELKTYTHKVEDDFIYPVHPSAKDLDESVFTSESDQSKLLYDSIFSLIDPSCKENISTKDSLQDALHEGRNAHFKHVGSNRSILFAS